jgi:1-acyl-sn-glycerol-3-phosphate acyltransferase
MVYRFVQGLMWVTFKIFFKRIDLVGREKLQQNHPVILIANHPGSFLDAMVLAVFLKRPIYFYVRGDIFKHPLVYRIFTALHMIPIFNREDGTTNLARNQQTFDRGRSLLSKGNLLLVFPEGFSRLSKKLSPFKKGTARVALQAAFDEPAAIGLSIQAVAVNYSAHRLGANLFIRVGDRLDLSNHCQLYRESPPKAINKLTVEMVNLFQDNVLHVKQGERTEVVDEVIRMLYNNPKFDRSLFFERVSIACTEISMMTDDEFENYQSLLNYQKRQLSFSRLSDAVIADGRHVKELVWKAILMSPFFLLGVVIWVIPGSVSKWIADKTVTREDFYTSVHSGVLGVMGFFWWLILLSTSLLNVTVLLSLLLFVSPLFGYIATRWSEEYKYLFAKLRLEKLMKVQQPLVDELISNRKKLLFF